MRFFFKEPYLCATYAAFWSQWNKTLMLHHLEIRVCVSIKQAHSCAAAARGWLVTRLVVKHTTLFQGWMTAISTKLMVRHLFFPSRHQYLMNGWEWPWLFTALVLHVLYVLQCKLSPFHSPKTGLTVLQSFEDNLNVSSCFVFHSLTDTDTHTCAHTQAVLIHRDR